MTTVSTSHTATGVGSTLTVAAKGETITFGLSGTYVATVIFEKAVGSGEEAWEKVAGPFSTANATESATYITRSTNEKFRSNCTAFTSSSAVAVVSDGVKVVDTHKDSDGVNVYADAQDRRTYVRPVTAPDFEATGSVLLRPTLLTPVVTRVAAPSTGTTSTSLSEAELLGGIHLKTPSAAQNFQFPKGAEISAALNAMLPADKQVEAGDSFDWTMVNLGGSGDIITVTVDTDLTFLGSVTLDDAGADINSSGTWRVRATSAAVWVATRIA